MKGVGVTLRFRVNRAEIEVKGQRGAQLTERFRAGVPLIADEGSMLSTAYATSA
jgi:hypothetical protein